jgi:hypothetical protein
MEYIPLRGIDFHYNKRLRGYPRLICGPSLPCDRDLLTLTDQVELHRILLDTRGELPTCFTMTGMQDYQHPTQPPG